MKIELHGNGFDEFEIPRFCQGVDIQAEGDIYPNGKYPVKAVDTVTVLGNNHLYISVTLRDDDEHLKANQEAAKAVDEASA